MIEVDLYLEAIEKIKNNFQPTGMSSEQWKEYKDGLYTKIMYEKQKEKEDERTKND